MPQPKYPILHINLTLMIIIIIIQVLFQQTSCLPACQNIELNGYKFELQTLKQLTQTSALTGSQFVRISLCSVIACNYTAFNGSVLQESGYVLLKKNQQTCMTYTYNQTGPLANMYSLLDSNQPSKGLSITYPPSYTTRTSLTEQINPQTQIPITVTTTQTHKSTTTIAMHCNTATQQAPSCTKQQRTILNEQISPSSIVKMIENTLRCEMYLAQGCPTLAVNHFWIFLINNRIAFAIVLWVCAAFLIVLGYLAIRVTILMFGAFTGGFFGVVFVAQGYTNFYLEADAIFIFTICLSVLMGLLFGIFLLTVPKLGYVNIGIFVAAIFSLLLQNSVLFLTGSLLAFYITFGVTAFLMTIIALMELRYFIIICTSFTGAFFFIRPLGFYLPGYPNQLISGKNFLISVKTPWQFYLYLGSILILTGIGIAIQRCINKKIIGRNKEANGQYYLEQQGTVRQKLKKIFEFKQIKQMIKAGKQEFVQLKNMITDDKNVKYSEYNGDDQQQDGGHYIQMQKMQKIQKEKQRQKQKQKQKQKIQFITPRSRPREAVKKTSQQVAPVNIQQYIGSEQESEQYRNRNKKNKNKNSKYK